MSAQSAAAAIQFEEFLAPRPSRWSEAGRLIRENPVGAVALAVLLILIAGAALADWIAPFAKTEVGTGQRLDGPNATNYFGTDRLGRDIFSRMLHGSRISLYVGFGSVALGTMIGSVVGLVSGFVGGWVDLIVQRLLDIMMSIPALLFAMVIVVAFGAGATNAMLAIAIIFIPGSARVVRSVTLSLRARQFVEAAQASGASTTRIVFRHILPSAIDEIMVLASLALGAAIIIEAALSFLGLGAQPPEPSWGAMLADGRPSFPVAPHMVYVPAAVISVTVLAANLLGDTVRDVLDPRLRGRSGKTHY